ncbi:MAG: acetylornithine transaminase [Nitrospiraceae bacterium]|jgi:acetylornithine aminotransferase/acetylornithine/N-succinyldiaminopimelate aminotransferase|nr:acetylornithine transaminase [Nitrospiraceae bacterium]
MNTSSMKGSTGSGHSSWVERGSRVLLGNYSRENLVFEKGKGSFLYDTRGDGYLDFLGGIAIHILGHSYPSIVHAIQKQAQRVTHISNLYYNIPAIELAEMLVEKTFADRVFFSNSGTEAIEAAIKLARRFGDSRGRFEIISMENSFHGRTLGAMTLTGQKKVREGFGPLPDGFSYARYNDLDDVIAKKTDRTVAVVVEPVQGEIGVIPATMEFMKDLRQWTHQEGILLILDEIQTGMGRTGALFAHELYGVVPDILVASKALGGGLPLGALLTTEYLATFLPPGSHGSTFGGNPVACAAGLALLRALYDEDFLPARIRVMAEYLWKGLSGLSDRHRGKILEIRGFGFMVGVRVSGSAKQMKEQFLENHVLVNATGLSDDIIRLLPPVSVGYDEMDQFLAVFDRILSGSPGLKG